MYNTRRKLFYASRRMSVRIANHGKYWTLFLTNFSNNSHDWLFLRFRSKYCQRDINVSKVDSSFSISRRTIELENLRDIWRASKQWRRCEIKSFRVSAKPTRLLFARSGLHARRHCGIIYASLYLAAYRISTEWKMQTRALPFIFSFFFIIIIFILHVLLYLFFLFFLAE